MIHSLLLMISRHTLMAYELEEPFAALMSSSARHSATDLTLRNADSRVCKKARINTWTVQNRTS